MRIKCLSATFIPNEGMNPYTDFYKFIDCNAWSVSEGTSIEDLGITLNPNKVYDMSIDQSSTCSGVFIRDVKNTEIYLLEFKRTNDMSADDFIFDFEMLINQLTVGNTFLHLIYEKPIKTDVFRSSQVLFQLEGTIRMWSRRYSQFKTSSIENIEPTSWKSTIVNKDKWGSNYTSKQASKDSIIELFPWAGFYGHSLNKDNDGYEAFGIMMGWYFCSFDPFGRPYVRGEEFRGNVGCVVFPDVDAEELANSLTQAEIETKWYVFNPKLSTFQNIVKSARRYEVAVIQVEEPHAILCACVEANIKYPGSGRLSLVVATPENMSAAARRIIGDSFHFYI